MLFILLGIAFIFLSFQVPLGAGGNYIDIFPDFVGYLILLFALEKPLSVNRWFKDASTVATVMLAVTFIQFLGSVSFLFPRVSIDAESVSFLLKGANFVFSFADPLVTAMGMIFMSFLCRGLGLSCEDRKKDFLSTVFFVLTIIFFALAAFAVVTIFFRSLPIQVWHIALPVGVVFGVFAIFGSRGVKELE